jgi:Dyp-type peroxidase family
LIELDEIQGNVVRAYGSAFSHARYLLLDLDSLCTPKASVAGWLDAATFGAPDRHEATAARLGIAFTFDGLAAFGVPRKVLRGFPADFREGASRRAKDVGDTGDDDWPEWGDFEKGHVLVTVHGKDSHRLDAFVEAHVRSALKPGRGPVDEVRAGHDSRAAQTRPRGPRACHDFNREQFGFADGCSQPAIAGVGATPAGDGIYAVSPRHGARAFRFLELAAEDLGIRAIPRHWRGLRAGEFLLGYENEEGCEPEGPPSPLGPNGTFMVYRVIEQHVARFHEYACECAEELRAKTGDPSWDAELVQAKIVGRWQDGTPLTLSPDRPDPAIAASKRRANDFLYRSRGLIGGDADGFGCPLGAHVRRVNPRDALPGGSERTMGHRIIRRGMPYDVRNEVEEMGLAFVCYGASIERGYEFILREWCNTGTAFGLGGERDFLLQQHKPLSGMTIPGPDGGTVRLPPPREPFTTAHGCAYLFAPSRAACDWLARAI